MEELALKERRRNEGTWKSMNEKARIYTEIQYTTDRPHQGQACPLIDERVKG